MHGLLEKPFEIRLRGCLRPRLVGVERSDERIDLVDQVTYARNQPLAEPVGGCCPVLEQPPHFGIHEGLQEEEFGEGISFHYTARGRDP